MMNLEDLNFSDEMIKFISQELIKLPAYKFLKKDDYMKDMRPEYFNISGKATITCDCGCTKIDVEKETEEGLTLYYFSVYELAFGARQNKFKQYLKRLWSAVTGKDYHLYELVLTEKDYKKLYF